MLCFNAGGVHRSWDVCFERKKGSRDSGRFWDGRGQGNEEGIREEHVVAKTLEVEYHTKHPMAEQISSIIVAYPFRFWILCLTWAVLGRCWTCSFYLEWCFLVVNSFILNCICNLKVSPATFFTASFSKCIDKLHVVGKNYQLADSLELCSIFTSYHSDLWEWVLLLQVKYVITWVT